MKNTLLLIVLVISHFLLGQDSSWINKADSVIMFAKSQLGVPYKWATCNPNISFDCSGLTSYAYSSCDISCSRISKNYNKNIRPVTTASFQQVREGIKKNTSMAWKKYSNYLNPMQDTLKNMKIKF